MNHPNRQPTRSVLDRMRNRRTDSDDSDGSDESEDADGPRDNYLHHCGETVYIEDAHKKKEPHWCKNCERSATFTRIERD